MEHVNVAIVGMGIGRANGMGFVRSRRGRVAALCDIAEERMRAFAAELPGPVKLYTDFKELCQDPEIDAVFVGTPNQYHVPVALEAVRNGKHVMVTKPLADSVEAARALVEAAEAAGVVNMMSLSTRFDPHTQYIGRRVQEGMFGEVYYGRARSVRRSGIPSWSLGFVQRGGGAFRDMGVHCLDAAWWMMGMPRPVSVSGVAGARFGPRGLGFWDYKPQPELGAQYAADDYAGGFIRFANGAGLQVESFWASHQPEEFQMEIFGTEAGARYKPLTIYQTCDGAPVDLTVTLPKGPGIWEIIADHFCDCILDGVACQAPLRHGLIVQEMMEALLESAELGREVQLGA
ncbi:MAG TPA: Gfo/Idh/MocA family oxidoreductase [Roseiflexaceae bacterium]|nr:Gfo/Idh/MocA family oxidoreductase [Roseiflexaceae bacterium]